jgi:hypothetical protein
MGDKIVNIKTGEGFEYTKSPTNNELIKSSSRYDAMIVPATYDKMKAPEVSQKEMRILADLYDKAYIHFETGALNKLKEETKKVLQPNEVYRSYVNKMVKKENESGSYNKEEEHLAELMNQTTPRERVNFESQYRVVQDAAIRELVAKGLGVRDAVANEEPSIVVDKYKMKDGSEHNILATLNPIVLSYDTSPEVDQYNHFAERAKLPVVEPTVPRCFKKDENGGVIYRVSIGTPLTGEHVYKEVTRSGIPELISAEAIAKIQAEAKLRDESR